MHYQAGYMTLPVNLIPHNTDTREVGENLQRDKKNEDRKGKRQHRNRRTVYRQIIIAPMRLRFGSIPAAWDKKSGVHIAPHKADTSFLVSCSGRKYDCESIPAYRDIASV
jgi:hypothetical protein